MAHITPITSMQSELNLCNNRVDIIIIGVSTGGPKALAEIFPHFPENLPVPIVIVQHMPPYFNSSLAERLTAKSQIEVLQGKTGEKLEPGIAWIARGGYHMIVEKKAVGVYLKMNREPHVNFCRPAVDVLFRSVVEIYGRNTLAVILTGLGNDGLVGCKYVKEAGGQVIVQDEESSVAWGMPGLVAQAGLADSILPLNEIGENIVCRLKLE